MEPLENPHPRREAYFEKPSDFHAWIAATQIGFGTDAKSACAIHVVDVTTREPFVAFFPSSHKNSTHYRALVAALRGAVEAVPPGSNICLFTDAEPIKKAFDNPAGRQEQGDLWTRLDDVLGETETCLKVSLPTDPVELKKLKKLKKLLRDWRKAA